MVQMFQEALGFQIFFVNMNLNIEIMKKIFLLLGEMSKISQNVNVISSLYICMVNINMQS